jgi:hypothetical protein
MSVGMKQMLYFLGKLYGLRDNFVRIVTMPVPFPNLYTEKSIAFFLTQEIIIENQQWFSECNEQLSKPLIVRNIKRKAIPVTGRESSQGCETSRHPHCLDSRLRDGGEVVSAMKLNLHLHVYTYCDVSIHCWATAR